MLPNFIVIGSPKCGTTSLCKLLGKHPQVFMSEVKEPHFFGRNDPNKTLAWYEQHFSACRNERAVGEGSTSYTHPHIIHAAAADIYRHIPDCRLIYIIRHPIKRLESDWKMRVREGWAEGPINVAVRKQETLVGHGMYWKNISVYLDIFPHYQILILFLEDFAKNPYNELKKCSLHLGVDANVKISDADKQFNVSNNYREDRFIAKHIRKTAAFNVLKNFMPLWLFKMLKVLLMKKYEYSIDWDPQLKKEIITQFKDDSKRILAYCHKPADFWSL